MRVALINNGTKEPEKLLALLSGNEIDIYPLEESAEVLKKPYDIVVLSGSSRFPIMYNLDAVAPELELIRTCPSPLVGICFGAELLTVAYGGTLRDSGYKMKGIFPISIDQADEIFLGRREFQAYEAHRWSIDQVPDELEVLATSPAGPEIVRHRILPQYGFQFHPEKMCDETYGDELFRALVTKLVPAA